MRRKVRELLVVTLVISFTLCLMVSKWGEAAEAHTLIQNTADPIFLKGRLIAS